MNLTPWDHGIKDFTRVGAKYQAHNTGELLKRLQDEHAWEPLYQWARRSHKVSRRPFALHAAEMRHPDAPTFQALGRTWTLSVYLRNAHDGTAALQSALTLSSNRVAAFVQAPAQARVRHSVANAQAQEIALAAAAEIPGAVTMLLTWQQTPRTCNVDELTRAALKWRYGTYVVDKDGIAHAPELRAPLYQDYQIVTKLDQYLAACDTALRGGYYLTTSQRMSRALKNVTAREPIMRAAWEWINAA
jgi:hypothetical protein